MHLNFSRQTRIFDPEKSKVKKVNIYGIGSVGSHAAQNLAKAGFSEIEVWDFDVVEGVNIPAQAFWPEHEGMKKTEAMKEIMEKTTNVTPDVHDEKVDEDTVIIPKPGTVYWCGIDKLEYRKILWEKIKRIPHAIYIDTRIGKYFMNYWFINTSNKKDVEWYEKSLDPERPRTDLGCGEKCCGPVNLCLVSNVIGNIWNICFDRIYHKYFYHHLLGGRPMYVQAEEDYKIV